MRILLKLKPATMAIGRKSCGPQVFSLLHHFTQRHRDPKDYRIVYTYVQTRLKRYRSNPGELWFDYSSRIFLQFQDKFHVNVSDKEKTKSFVELEEVLNQYQGPRNSIEFQIVNLMSIHKQSDVILDYMKFLRQKNGDQEISLVLIKRAIQGIILYKPDEGLKLILEYEERMPKGSLEIGFLIKHLSFTKDWKYGLKLLKENSHTLFPKTSVFNFMEGDSVLFYILVAALKNSEMKIYNDLKSQYIMLKAPSIVEHVSEWLEVGFLTPDILLEILTNYIHGATYELASLMKDEFKRYWGNTIDIQLVNMADITDKSLVCPACGEVLMKPTFTKQELKALEGNIIKGFLAAGIPRDELLDELDRLWHFIEKNGPFDIVIDTLNVTSGSYYDRLDMEAEQIKKEMWNKLGISNARVLFVAPGRRRRFKAYDRDYAVFKCYLDGLDDWFVILGALKSGQHTYFLSSDLYRDHFRWQNRDSFSVFLKWKYMQQIYLQEQSRKVKGRVQFMERKPIINLPFESASGWHIPFSYPKSPDGTKTGFLMLSETYMCIRKLKNWKPSSLSKTVLEEAKVGNHTEKYPS